MSGREPGRACPGGPAVCAAPAGSRSDRRPRLVRLFPDRGTPVQIGCFARSQIGGARGRRIGEKSSCQEREWRGLLFLRNPPALRHGRATQIGRPQPSGPAAHARVARPCAQHRPGRAATRGRALCVRFPIAALRFKLGSRLSALFQRPAQVGDQVVGVLDADGNAQRLFGDARGTSRLGRHRGVAHRLGMFHE